MQNSRPHHVATTLRDRFAFGFVKSLRLFADLFFRRRYGHRAVVLETVAAVPGMVGGMLQHLKSLRKIRDDHGWIKELLDEAENERMHLMTFVQIAQPTLFERLLILIAQCGFFLLYLLIYLFSPITAHRIVGYFEEEAVVSYDQFLAEIDEGRIANVEAPQIAKKYWQLSDDATLRDVVIKVRADEEGHRDRNHDFANAIISKTEDTVISNSMTQKIAQ